MSPADMIAWVMTWPLLLDGRPGFAVRNPIPRPAFAPQVMVEASIAFIDERTKLGKPSMAPELYVAFLDVFAARESGYRIDAAGDCPGMRPGDPKCTVELGALSFGAWQSPVARTPKTAASKFALAMAQAKVALTIFQASAEMCPSHPVSAYMTGHCSAVGSMREAEIAAQMASPLPVPP